MTIKSLIKFLKTQNPDLEIRAASEGTYTEFEYYELSESKLIIYLGYEWDLKRPIKIE